MTRGGDNSGSGSRRRSSDHCRQYLLHAKHFPASNARVARSNFVPFRFAAGREVFVGCAHPQTNFVPFEKHDHDCVRGIDGGCLVRQNLDSIF